MPKFILFLLASVSGFAGRAGEAARRIRTLLSESSIMPAARVVEMSISDKGLHVSRS